MRVAIVGNGLVAQSIATLPRETQECCEFACYEDFDSECACRGCNPRITMLSHAACDITSESSIRAALAQYRPDVVINTAALHTLAACEEDPRRAFDLNARAAGRLAKLVPTVYISTDYVFTDGGPHDESMPGSQPRSVYGRSKLAGELETLEHGGIVVRVSALYGHYVSRAKGNKGFPDAFLSSHDTIKLPTDQQFSPTYAPDAAERILRLAFAMLINRGFHNAGAATFPDDPKEVIRTPAEGIYHAANKGSTTWAEFAEHIIALTQHQRHVIPYFAKDTLRPPNSALKSTRLPQLRHWAAGLSAWAQREGRQTIVSPRRVDDD